MLPIHVSLLEVTEALAFGCVLPTHRVRVRVCDPGMQRLMGFRSPDTARDTQLLQVLWEQTSGYPCASWGKDQSMRSCFVDRELKCQRKHNGDRLIMSQLQEELHLKLSFP